MTIAEAVPATAAATCPVIARSEATKQSRAACINPWIALSAYGLHAMTLAWNPLRSRERHARHRGSFHGECDEILGLEIVDVALAAGARDGLGLEREHGEVIREPAPGGS